MRIVVRDDALHYWVWPELCHPVHNKLNRAGNETLCSSCHMVESIHRTKGLEASKMLDFSLQEALTQLQHQCRSRERELHREGGKSLLAYVKGVDPHLIHMP